MLQLLREFLAQGKKVILFMRLFIQRKGDVFAVGGIEKFEIKWPEDRRVRPRKIMERKVLTGQSKQQFTSGYFYL